MVVAYLRIFRAAQRQAKFIQSLSMSIGTSIDRLDLTLAGNGSSVTLSKTATTTTRTQRVVIVVVVVVVVVVARLRRR